MIQEASAALSSIFTNKFVVKAIKPTLKLAIANITSAMTFALDHFDPMRGNFITLSTPTTSDETEVTLVVTSPSGLISYNVPLVIFKTGDTVLETYNAEDEWVGYTVAGDGITVGTTVIAYTARRPVSASATLRSGPTGGGGFTLDLRQKYQVKINTAALGIPWVEGADYTFEVSEGFVVDTDTERGFTSPAQNIAYTANPALAIESSDPTPGATATVNNDYITFTLNRPILPYVGENFYFYKSVGSTDTLLKTFSVNSGIISGRTITLDVRGLMQDSTTYYVKSDDEILRDSDNFVFNQLNTNFGFRFTSASQPAFNDLASLVMSAGTIQATANKIVKTAVAMTSAASIYALCFVTQKIDSVITATMSISARRVRSTPATINLTAIIYANTSPVFDVAGDLVGSGYTSYGNMGKYDRLSADGTYLIGAQGNSQPFSGSGFWYELLKSYNVTNGALAFSAGIDPSSSSNYNYDSYIYILGIATSADGNVTLVNLTNNSDGNTYIVQALNKDWANATTIATGVYSSNSRVDSPQVSSDGLRLAWKSYFGNITSLTVATTNGTVIASKSLGTNLDSANFDQRRGVAIAYATDRSRYYAIADTGNTSVIYQSTTWSNPGGLVQTFYDISNTIALSKDARTLVGKGYSSNELSVYKRNLGSDTWGTTYQSIFLTDISDVFDISISENGKRIAVTGRLFTAGATPNYEYKVVILDQNAFNYSVSAVLTGFTPAQTYGFTLDLTSNGKYLYVGQTSSGSGPNLNGRITIYNDITKI